MHGANATLYVVENCVLPVLLVIESFLPNDLIITSGARGRRFFYVTKTGKSKTTRWWLSFVFLSTVRICRFFNREDYNGFQ